MAYWIRGGGEYTVHSALPSGTANKRTYYAHDDDAEPCGPPCPLDSEKRRRVAYDAQVQVQVQVPVPECDVPYRSIEPCDPPAAAAAADRSSPVFYVLYEEGFDRTAGRLLPEEDRLRDTESRSPLPPPAHERERLYAAVAGGGPKHWAKGAHLRTSDMDEPLGLSARMQMHTQMHTHMHTHTPMYTHSSMPSSAQSPGSTPQWTRYEEWREHNSAYDMAADQEEEMESRAYSPFVRLPSPAAHVPRAPVSTDGSSHAAAATRDGHTANYFVSDDEAADNVAAHLASFMRRHPSSRQERILRSLIHPKSATGTADFELDDDALNNILHTANDLFFGGRLRHRVRWDWSGTNADPQYDSRIIGHTSLRPRHQDDGGGIETFVRLSTPILKNRAYSRRLLISAFLHELIHCYLFICCGWEARKDGGHTAGFRRIADTIDQWAGRDNLFLCQVEADLEQFRQAPLPLPLFYVLNDRYHACRSATHAAPGAHGVHAAPAAHYGQAEAGDWWGQW